MDILSCVEFIQHKDIQTRLVVCTGQTLNQKCLDIRTTLARLLNPNYSEFNANYLFNITGDNIFIISSEQSAPEEYVQWTNWAHRQGGHINECNMSYTKWLKAWDSQCANLGDAWVIEVNDENETMHFGEWLNNNSTKRIGTNSGQRSWFLSLLYCLIGQSRIMNILKSQTGSDILLYKILLFLKLSIVYQRNNTMDNITQFVEALLLGHHFSWEGIWSVDTAFAMIDKLCPNISVYFTVEYEMMSYCSVHRKKYHNETLKAARLSFANKVYWNQQSGLLSVNNHTGHFCPNEGCLTNKKYFRITNSNAHTLVLYFKHGIPTNMWKELLIQRTIKVGTVMRNVWTAIFYLERDSKYVCGYLLDNDTNNKLKWLYFDTHFAIMRRMVNIGCDSCHYLFLCGP